MQIKARYIAKGSGPPLAEYRPRFLMCSFRRLGAAPRSASPPQWLSQPGEMLTAAWLPSAHLGAIARPALRLGGEWAGWRCAFDPFSGALRSEVQGFNTERWESNALRRRSALLLPDDDGGIRRTSTGDADWSTLPVAVS